MRPYPL